MASRSTYPLYNRLTDGQLESLLRAWRAEGLSFAEITYRLRDQDIATSASTVHRWCHELGIETEQRAS